MTYSIYLIIFISTIQIGLGITLEPQKQKCISSGTTCFLINLQSSKLDPHIIPVSNVNHSDTIRTLSVVYSNVPIITSSICETLPNLKKVEFDNAGVEKVDENAFHLCNNLDELEITSNQIEILEKNTFNYNPLLRTLSLHDNDLQYLHIDLFVNLTSLTRLDLSLNEFTHLPPQIFRNLNKLSELVLYHNRLIELDAEQMIKDLPKLSRIRIRDNDFHCDRLSKILEVFGTAHVSFWEYSGQRRSRTYTVTYVKGIECLNDEQHEREIYLRKNLPDTISKLRVDVDEIKEQLNAMKGNIFVQNISKGTLTVQQTTLMTPIVEKISESVSEKSVHHIEDHNDSQPKKQTMSRSRRNIFGVAATILVILLFVVILSYYHKKYKFLNRLNDGQILILNQNNDEV